MRVPRASCSYHRPQHLSPGCPCARAPPGSCRVRDLLCAGFCSRVFVNILARPILCVCVPYNCATCFRKNGCRVRGGGGGGRNPPCAPPSLAPLWSVLPPATVMGREDSSGSDRLFRSVFTMSDVVCRACMFWGLNKGAGAKNGAKA